MEKAKSAHAKLTQSLHSEIMRSLIMNTLPTLDGLFVTSDVALSEALQNFFPDTAVYQFANGSVSKCSEVSSLCFMQ